MTVDELADFLRGLQGAKILSVTSLTVPRQVKFHPDTKQLNVHWPMRKLQRTVGVINCSYASCCDRARARDAVRQGLEEIQAKRPLKRKWGARIKATPLVAHVDAAGQRHLYLDFRPTRVIEVALCNARGKPLVGLVAQRAAEYLRPSPTPRRGDAPWRDFRLDHLLEIRAERQILSIAAPSRLTPRPSPFAIGLAKICEYS